MECFLNQVKDVRLPQSLQRAMAAEAEAAREARAKVVMMLMVMMVTVTVMSMIMPMWMTMMMALVCTCFSGIISRTSHLHDYVLFTAHASYVIIRKSHLNY